MHKIPLYLLLLFVAACGFHPVYGVNKYTAVGVEEYLAQIHINNIPDRKGQYLRNALIDRFYRDGRPENPRYTLDVEKLSEGTRELDVTVDSDTTRAQFRLSANMRLIDNKTKEVLLKRKLQSIATYNVLSSEFANRISEQNTRENTLDDIARQVEEHIALYFKRSQK